MKDMTHQFLDWLRSKPADEGYNYWCNECAIGRFLVDNGYAAAPVMCCDAWIEDDGLEEVHIYPEAMDEASRGNLEDGYTLHTFGAAAERLEKLLAS